MNVNKYLERIGFTGPFLAPSLASLTGLQRCHQNAVTWENFDANLGRRITLDL